jgi:hypothetical protein
LIVEHAGRKGALAGVVVLQGQRQLTDLIEALGAPSRFTGGLNGRQQ